ncbi:MAG TPA: LysR family transcriptional regulator [Micrococcaceae bacterium]|jgi:DNA-binding transcriptional LysR family regulator|nr:LysR family transcriptional regulator [Micrococcaceae bacterium]
MFSLDQLRGFVAVADELHFGRAAERLNMTQPPLSRQIQKLERAIGVQLFERDNRRVTLTPAGQAFLSEAQKLLALAMHAPDRARRISEGSAGVVRIGFTSASTFGLLGALLNEIAHRLPDVDVELQEMVSREQTNALAADELDMGLARPPFDPDEFDGRLLYREPIVVALPAGHSLAGLNRPLRPEDLNHQDLIMHSPTRARYFYDLLAGVVSQTQANIVHTVTQVQTMISLVAAARGIALVPQSAMALGIGGVEYVEMAGFTEDPVELHAIWRKDSRNPALKRILAFLDESVF